MNTAAAIYLAVYMTGKLLGVLGPLPLDIDQCREMAGAMLSEQAKAARVALVCTTEVPRK